MEEVKPSIELELLETGKKIPDLGKFHSVRNNTASQQSTLL